MKLEELKLPRIIDRAGQVMIRWKHMSVMFLTEPKPLRTAKHAKIYGCSD